MATAIQQIERHSSRIKAGKATVKPGQPCRIPESWACGDACAQGDLIIVVLDAIPAGYVRVENPTDADRQLVPGNTQGAKHCLDSLAGVALYRPAGWPQSAETDFRGPAFVLTEERTILHPTHGPIMVPAGFAVGCEYQREFDAMQQRERRNAD